MTSQAYAPFRPGAGRVPPLLAGREELLESFRVTIRQATDTSEGPRPWVLFGLRGVGKTALLNQFVIEARERRWITIKLEATPRHDLAQAIAQALYRPLRDARPISDIARELLARAVRVFAGFQILFDPSGAASFGFNVEPEQGVGDTGNLPSDLTDIFDAIGQAARADGVGVLLALDELQDAPPADLGALNVALHALGQEAFPVPVFFIGAGLPSLPAVLADATSYAERLYDFRSIGLLNDEASRAAFTVPTESQGVSWSADALAAVTGRAQGYPYLIQVCGQYAWEEHDGDTIALTAAQLGLSRAQREVDEGLYRSRWERAAPKQRAYMRAMAVDNQATSLVGELVTRLRRSNQAALSVTRRDLIAAGLIYAPERGQVAFTVPGMAEYINRQPEG
jgi:hypothetical protein